MVNWVVVGELELRVPRKTVRRIKARRVHRRRRATASIVCNRNAVLCRKRRRTKNSTGLNAELEITSRRAALLKHRHIHPEPV